MITQTGTASQVSLKRCGLRVRHVFRLNIIITSILFKVIWNICKTLTNKLNEIWKGRAGTKIIVINNHNRHPDLKPVFISFNLKFIRLIATMRIRLRSKNLVAPIRPIVWLAWLGILPIRIKSTIGSTAYLRIDQRVDWLWWMVPQKWSAVISYSVSNRKQNQKSCGKNLNTRQKSQTEE